jgi:hypothetical protein
MERTPLEMLELLVHSIKLSTDKAHETGNALAMCYNYHSVIVQEAVSVIRTAKEG